ncbi:hypothetical protein AB7M11_003029 [Bradyrhizobium ottawaense]
MSSRAAESATKVLTASSRRAIAGASVSGAARRWASRREPRRGHRAVDRIEQRAAAFAGERSRQFQIGARGRVDRHRCARGFARGRRQRRMLADLGAVDIGDGCCCCGSLQPCELRQPVHGRDGKVIAQPLLGGGAVEDVARQGCHGRQLAQGLSELVVVIERVGDDGLVRVDARQRCGELAARAFHHGELGGRDVDPGEAEAVAAGRGAGARDREQIIVGAGIEQRVFGQRARRDQPHHAAADHTLVATRLRGSGILGLLADRDAVPGRDQAVQIVLGALDRHAAHRDVGALMLAALRQHDAERPGGDLGVLEEQLVEVTHPVEQQ